MIKRTNRGFTLIEIMLVIIIIGCAAGIVILSIPGGPSPKIGFNLKNQTETLATTIQTLSDQAATEGRTIGLWINPHGYAFMVRDLTPADQPVDASSTSNDMDAKTVSQAQSNLDTPLNWDQQKWQPLASERIKTSTSFGNDATFSLSLEGMQLQDEENMLGRSSPQWFDTENHLKTQTPQILLLPSGEITPFLLTLTDSEGHSRQIKGNASGQISILIP